MDIIIDQIANAMYIKFTQAKFASNKVIDENTIIDLDENSNLIGIELLEISKRIPREQLSDVHISMPTAVCKK